MMANNLVTRQHTGKLAVSREKQEYIEKSIVYHMGYLKRAFRSAELQEEFVENADETHFVFNIDNGRTIGLRGDDHFKYADIVSGDEWITMMVRIKGGPRASI